MTHLDMALVVGKMFLEISAPFLPILIVWAVWGK